MERKPIKITLSFACYWLLKFFLAGKVGPIIGKIEYPGTQSGGGVGSTWNDKWSSPIGLTKWRYNNLFIVNIPEGQKYPQ